MKRIIKIVVVLAVLGVIVGGIAYYKMTAGIPAVSLAAVSRGPVEESVDETAEAILDRTRVLTTATGGNLLPVTLEPGDRVKKGDVVAHIDAADILARMDAARAQVDAFKAHARSAEAQKPKPAAFEQARLAVEGAQKRLAIAKTEAAALAERKKLADLTLKRTRLLHEEGLAGEARVDELRAQAQVLAQQQASAREAVSAAETGIKAAEAAKRLLEEAGNDPEFLKEAYLAQARASEAALTSLTIEKGRLELKAPFDGIVLERFTRGGQVVTPGIPVLSIGDLDSLEVEVEVLSDDIASVRIDRKAVVFGGALGEGEVEGKVRKIYPKAFSKISSLGIEQKRVKVRVSLPPGTGLQHGYRVEVRIITRDHPNVLRVTSGAVFRRDGKDHVFTAGEEWKLSLVPVKIGLTNEDWAEITGGLNGGEQVVTDPREELKDGMKVKAREED